MSVQSDRWKDSPAYADLTAALAEFGYRSHEEALAVRSRSDRERARYEGFQRRWTALMVERAQIQPEPRYKAPKSKRSARNGPPSQTAISRRGEMRTGSAIEAVRQASIARGIANARARREAEPIPGGTLATMRAELERALEPGRAKGRKALHIKEAK